MIKSVQFSIELPSTVIVGSLVPFLFQDGAAGEATLLANTSEGVTYRVYFKNAFSNGLYTVTGERVGSNGISILGQVYPVRKRDFCVDVLAASPPTGSRIDVTVTGA